MVQPGKYRHYKGKNYQVLKVVMHTETQQPMVYYKALYPVAGDNDLYGKEIHFVRPLDMWLEKVKLNGTTIDRFTLIKL